MIRSQYSSVHQTNIGRFSHLVRATQIPRRRRQQGASLVEYAFIVIAFMSVIFGISAFGHMLFVYHHLNNAAKEATRYASVRGSTCGNDANGGSCAASNSATGTSGPTTAADIQAYVLSITPPGIDTSQLVVPTGTYSCGTALVPATCSYFCGVSGTACSPPITGAPASCNTANTANGDGCTVAVTVAYSYNFIFPLLPSVTTTTAPCTKPGYCLSSTSEMVIVH
jgi:Flp pilus assembly protein TadG